jgi:hypothetical protein
VAPFFGAIGALLRVAGLTAGGLYAPTPWGARWAPSRSQVPSDVICHQKSTCNSAGSWVVRWVLSTPPGHPAAGWCGRVVPVPPLLLCTRPTRAWPSVGGQSPAPSRSALAPVRGVRLPGGPNTLPVSSAIHPRLPFVAHKSSSRQMGIRCLQLHAGLLKAALSPGRSTADRSKSRAVADRHTEEGRPRKRKPQVCSFGFFHRISKNKSPRLTHGRDVSPPTSSATKDIRDGRISDTRAWPVI